MGGNNRDVTGVRLVKKANTIRIEIQKGTLGRMGTIINNSTEWISRVYEKPTKEDIAGNFVHKIEWNGGRGINLNELHALEDHVIAGLKFEKSREHGVNLVMFTQSYNTLTGELLIGDFHGLPYKITAPELPNEEILELDNLDVPTLAPNKNRAIEETKAFLNFTTTGWQQDVGQTIIPYFDTQEVTTSVHVPMSAVGLYYKSYDIFGGYLGLKLFTFNLANLV